MIEINNLNFSYTKNSPIILNDINLNIEKGTYLSILGSNGSAKSTLIKIILNLLKPNSGSININTKSIGYVPQKLDILNSQFPISISELLYCHLRAIKSKDPSIIMKSLNAVGMADYKNTLIGNLSGGQTQKIFIARALMGNPELLILDEPSTGIDIQSQEEIYSIITNLNRNLGITVVSVEHNLKAALENSTQIFRLSKGTGTLYSIEEYRRKYNIVEDCF